MIKTDIYKTSYTLQSSKTVLNQYKLNQKYANYKKILHSKNTTTK